MGRDRFSAPDSIDPLIRFPFHADLIDLDGQRRRETPANGLLERRDFRALEDDDDVDVTDVETCLTHQTCRVLKKVRRSMRPSTAGPYPGNVRRYLRGKPRRGWRR